MTLTVFTTNGTSFSGANDPYDPTQFPVMAVNALLPSPWQLIADQFDGLATTPMINWWANPYAAAVYPMGASVNTGIGYLEGAVLSTAVGTPKALVSYSQGAVVASRFWRDYVLNPSGSCHAYLDDFVAAVNWGNPLRCPTIPANGNTFAGWAQPGGGGIAGTDDLTPEQTPDWWYDFANPNDLYTDSPVGTDAGTDEQLIYDMVMVQDFGGTLDGLLKLVETAEAEFTNPTISEIVGIATAIWNGLTFLVAGPNAGHYTYDPSPAIDYLGQVAAKYA